MLPDIRLCGGKWTSVRHDNEMCVCFVYLRHGATLIGKALAGLRPKPASGSRIGPPPARETETKVATARAALWKWAGQHECASEDIGHNATLQVRQAHELKPHVTVSKRLPAFIE